MNYGTCLSVSVLKNVEHLKVVLLVDHGELGQISAILPEREKAALLPRSLFCPERLCIEPETLPVLETTIKRLLVGRRVKVWEFQGSWYCAFPSWRNVKIIKQVIKQD